MLYDILLSFPSSVMRDRGQDLTNWQNSAMIWANYHLLCHCKRSGNLPPYFSHKKRWVDLEIAPSFLLIYTRTKLAIAI